MKLSSLVLAAVGALAAGWGVAGVVQSGTVLSLLTQAVIYGVFALGVGLLLRQNGMVSFGHALYFGLAGYSVGITLELGLLPAEAVLILTPIVVGAIAFVIGAVIVRVPGVAFSMLTLAVGQMAFLTASRSRGVTGGADGMNIPWPETLFGVSESTIHEPAVLFMLCWTVLVLVMLGLALMLRSRFGTITECARDNEERARFIGLRTIWPRAAVYALSAVVASLAGLLSAINTAFISPESLHWSVSGMALMMVVVGGYKAIWGPPLGAIVYFLFKDVLGDWAEHWMAIFGIALITIIVFSPTGLAGILKRLVNRRRSADATAKVRSLKPEPQQ